MGIKHKSFDKNNNLRAMSRGAQIFLPPDNNAALLAATALSNAAFTAGSAITLLPGETSIWLPWAWAIVFTKAQVGGADGGALTVRVTGRNQFDEPVSELVVITSTQGIYQTVNAYRYVESIVTVSKTSDDDTVAIGFEGDVGSSKCSRVGTPWRMKRYNEIQGMIQVTNSWSTPATITPTVAAAADFSESAQTISVSGHNLTAATPNLIMCFPNYYDASASI